MLFSLTMFPIGAGPSIGGPVSEVIEEIDRAGLHYEVSGMDTVVEGTWEQVMPVVERAEKQMRARYGRVFMTLTVDDQPNEGDRLHGSVADVERRLGHRVQH
jgi:uncharacterized protein (TIGR00106 family)